MKRDHDNMIQLSKLSLGLQDSWQWQPLLFDSIWSSTMPLHPSIDKDGDDDIGGEKWSDHVQVIKAPVLKLLAEVLYIHNFHNYPHCVITIFPYLFVYNIWNS